VTSFFQNWFASDGSAPNFFQGLEENACSLQPAMKSTAPSL